MFLLLKQHGSLGAQTHVPFHISAKACELAQPALLENLRRGIRNGLAQLVSEKAGGLNSSERGVVVIPVMFFAVDGQRHFISDRRAETAVFRLEVLR